MFADRRLTMVNRIGRERASSRRASGMRCGRSPVGAVAAASIQPIAEKLLYEHELFGDGRYVRHMSVGHGQSSPAASSAGPRSIRPLLDTL